MAQSIIIVEDECIIALMLKNFLTAQGYKILGTAMDGHTAIELIRNSKPDLIILDIHIKGNINGLETYKIIQKTWDIPAVFLTGSSSEIVNIEKNYPNVLILEKPVSLQELKKTIDKTFAILNKKTLPQ